MSLLIQRQPDRLQKLISGLRKQGKSVGFVPTMGALHEGHGALVRASRRECDITVVSIFVNPAQFGPKEDWGRYPRPVSADIAALKKWKADILFHPAVKAVYPEGFNTVVQTGAGHRMKGKPSLQSALCGPFRPGHFDGVCTVVCKLFNTVMPDRTYFGQKDYQQAVILKAMIRDLNLRIDLRMIPTVRENDGLAMSSRNRYLSARERQSAVLLSKALFEVRRKLQSGGSSINKIKTGTMAFLKAGGLRVQYLDIVDPDTLAKVIRRQKRMVVAAGCYVGKTRLIDNVIIRIPI